MTLSHPRREPVDHADPQVAAAIQTLLGTLGEDVRHRDLVHELLTRVCQLPESTANRGEMKILAATLKDFRMAFDVFGAHRESKKISIFGSARSPAGSPIYEHCKEFAAEAVKRDYMVITGAGPGIMQAGNEGATADKSFGVSIMLPFEARSNPVIEGDPKLVEFKYFFTRKLTFVKESDAIVLYPGGFGTMDEGFETLTLLQTGKCDPLPVILMDTPGGSYWPSWERYLRENLLQRELVSSYDRNLYRYSSNIQQALDEIDLFYRHYHSIRYVGDTTILRLKRVPSPGLLAELTQRYGDLLKPGGAFEVLAEPHPAERNEPAEVRALPRLGFRFVQRRFGRLRRLIDALNLSEDYVSDPVQKVPPRSTGAFDLNGIREPGAQE